MSLLGFSAHTLPLLKIMLNSLSLLLILLQLATLSSAQPTFVKYLCDNTYGNYTTNSTYQQNLNTLLSNISSNTHITYGFYNFSSGNDPNTVNGLAYCRGDVLLDDCRSCIKNATAEISSLCTNQKQAIGWYDDCMIRYTNRSIFGVMEVKPVYWIRNRYKALNQSDFSSKLDGLFMSLVNTAAAGNSTLKFAIGKAYVSTFITIYSYTQCTPDLSQSDCYNCLSETISSLHVCCIPYQGARIYTPSCHIRYETYGISNVFDAPASEAPSPSSLLPTLAVSTPPTPGRGKGSTTSKVVVVVVVITVGIAVVCLLLVGIFYFCVRKDRRKWKKANNESEQEDDITTSETLLFAYAEIKDATQDFAEANKLGRGGFGTVYKGVIANGREIAVKRLSRNSNQGEQEFMTEVQLLAKLQHRNLVKLLGFSFAGEERLLIYEFMPNASLDHILFGKSNHVSLDWKTRYNIIGGIARGLVYLHEDSRVRIIHRDLKASNILLDANLNPKIADFGMARLFQADQTHANTQRIAGTYGYMAPEYAKRGIFSVKSDVYSFGILVLEIICGQKNSSILQNENMEGLVASVWRNWREGTASIVVDSALVSASRGEIMRCIQIGLLCVQADPADRPTMSSVNLMLSSGSFSMALPSQPAYVQQRSLAVDQQKEYVTEEESITDLYPR